MWSIIGNSYNYFLSTIFHMKIFNLQLYQSVIQCILEPCRRKIRYTTLEKIEQLKELLLTDSSNKYDVNYVSITKQEYDLLQRKSQENKERASKRIREAFVQVEDANLKENESFQKLHVVNSNLENCRKTVDQSSEQLEVV